MAEKYKGPIEEVKLMEKVKLTKEQAEAIEQVKDKDYAINILALQKRPDHPLATLEISLIAKLLYGLVEYEIKPGQPEFSRFDRVVRLDAGEVVPGSKIALAWNYKDNGFIELKDIQHKFNHKVSREEIRHATKEEIYWFETLGRNKVSDFRMGDVYIDEECRAEVLEKERHVELAKEWHAAGDFKGLYPGDSFKPYPKVSAAAFVE